MSNVDDIDLDVTSDDIEDSGPRKVNPGRYLFQIVEMGVQESKSGTVFLYQAKAIDTQVESNEGCLSARVFEIINVEKYKMRDGEYVTDDDGNKAPNKALWRLDELLGGGFGLKEWKKIPGSIKDSHFTALAFVETFNGEERTKLKGHKVAAGWEGMNAVVDDDGKVTMTGKPNGSSKSSGSKSKPDNASDFEDDDIDI